MFDIFTFLCDAESPGFRETVRTYPAFFHDPRNIFIMLCADGICPFENADDTSITPICFTILNLPPELRGKKEYVGTWGIYESRPGHSALRNKKKIESKPFFELLVNELLELWHDGVLMYDAAADAVFRLRVMLYKIVMDYKGIEDVARIMGSNAISGCAKCTIKGIGKNRSKLNKVVYSEMDAEGGAFSTHTKHRVYICLYMFSNVTFLPTYV